MEFLLAHKVEVLALLLALSELLGSVDRFKSSSVLGLVKNVLKDLLAKAKGQ